MIDELIHMVEKHPEVTAIGLEEFPVRGYPHISLAGGKEIWTSLLPFFAWAGCNPWRSSHRVKKNNMSKLYGIVESERDRRPMYLPHAAEQLEKIKNGERIHTVPFANWGVPLRCLFKYAESAIEYDRYVSFCVAAVYFWEKILKNSQWMAHVPLYRNDKQFYQFTEFVTRLSADGSTCLLTKEECKRVGTKGPWGKPPTVSHEKTTLPLSQPVFKPVVKDNVEVIKSLCFGVIEVAKAVNQDEVDQAVNGIYNFLTSPSGEPESPETKSNGPVDPTAFRSYPGDPLPGRRPRPENLD